MGLGAARSHSEGLPSYARRPTFPNTGTLGTYSNHSSTSQYTEGTGETMWSVELEMTAAEETPQHLNRKSYFFPGDPEVGGRSQGGRWMTSSSSLLRKKQVTA